MNGTIKQAGRILSSHNSGYDDHCLLRCDTEQSDVYVHYGWKQPVPLRSVDTCRKNGKRG